MIVFRIECDDTGIGPHRADNGLFLKRMERNGYNMYDFSDHPVPASDISGWNYLYADDRNEYRFGFENMKDLRKWFFTECIGWFDETAYSIVLYEIDEEFVLWGGSQIAFFLSKAVKMGSFKPG